MIERLEGIYGNPNLRVLKGGACMAQGQSTRPDIHLVEPIDESDDVKPDITIALRARTSLLSPQRLHEATSSLRAYLGQGSIRNQELLALLERGEATCEDEERVLSYFDHSRYTDTRTTLRDGQIRTRDLHAVDGYGEHAGLIDAMSQKDLQVGPSPDEVSKAIARRKAIRQIVGMKSLLTRVRNLSSALEAGEITIDDLELADLGRINRVASVLDLFSSYSSESACDQIESQGQEDVPQPVLMQNCRQPESNPPEVIRVDEGRVKDPAKRDLITATAIVAGWTFVVNAPRRLWGMLAQESYHTAETASQALVAGLARAKSEAVVALANSSESTIDALNPVVSSMVGKAAEYAFRSIEVQHTPSLPFVESEVYPEGYSADVPPQNFEDYRSPENAPYLIDGLVSMVREGTIECDAHWDVDIRSRCQNMLDQQLLPWLSSQAGPIDMRSGQKVGTLTSNEAIAREILREATQQNVLTGIITTFHNPEAQWEAFQTQRAYEWIEQGIGVIGTEEASVANSANSRVIFSPGQSINIQEAVWSYIGPLFRQDAYYASLLTSWVANGHSGMMRQETHPDGTVEIVFDPRLRGLMRYIVQEAELSRLSPDVLVRAHVDTLPISTRTIDQAAYSTSQDTLLGSKPITRDAFLGLGFLRARAEAVRVHASQADAFAEPHPSLLDRIRGVFRKTENTIVSNANPQSQITRRALLRNTFFAGLGAVALGGVAEARSHQPEFDSLKEAVSYRVARVLVHEPPCSPAVVDRHGRLIATLSSPDSTFSFPVDYSVISPHVINALVASENRSFWHDSGVDPKGLARALWQTSQEDGQIQGASTITMLLAKIAGYSEDERADLRPESRVKRKMEQIGTALVLSQHLSKEEIITRFLNSADFGRHAVGIEAAARAYFGISASELRPHQAASLIALINRPGSLSQDSLEAEHMRDHVLYAMHESGLIDRDAYRREYHMPFGWIDDDLSLFRGGVEGSYHMLSRIQSETHHAARRIETTLDLGLQHRAESVLQATIADIETRVKATGLNGSVMIVDQQGEVRAYVANRYDPLRNPDAPNSALDQCKAGASPGSAMKPVIFAARVESGELGSDSTVVDEPYTFYDGLGRPFTVENWDSEDPARAFDGPMPAGVALASSKNTVAVENAVAHGPTMLANILHRCGLSSPASVISDTPSRYTPLNALGVGNCATTEELATAYTTLAAGGIRPSLHFIQRQHASGTDIVTHHRGVRVLSEQTAHIVAQWLATGTNFMNGYGHSSPMTTMPDGVLRKTGTGPAEDGAASMQVVAADPETGLTFVIRVFDPTGASIPDRGTGTKNRTLAGRFLADPLQRLIEYTRATSGPIDSFSPSRSATIV